MDSPMSKHVMWAFILILGMSLLLVAALIGSIQLFSVDSLTDYFFEDHFRVDPPMIELRWNLKEIIAVVIGVAALLSLIWVAIISFGKDILAPGYPRRRRPIWWACLVLGAAAAATAGYFLGSAPWLANDVPPDIAASSAVVFLISYWLVTIFSTPFMVRSGVPLGNLIAGKIRFP